jgi:hypothetical protein
MSAQITRDQLQRPAYIYVRQSTMGQVRHHQESTERQYAPREKALPLGWTLPLIRVLDADLGQPGASSAQRQDFRTLVTEVSMDRVGAVFASEVYGGGPEIGQGIETHMLRVTVLVELDAGDERGLVLGAPPAHAARTHATQIAVVGDHHADERAGVLALGCCHQALVLHPPSVAIPHSKVALQNTPLEENPR